MKDLFTFGQLVGLSLLALSLGACGGPIDEPEPPTGIVEPDLTGSCQDRPSIPACGSGDVADKDYDHDGIANCKDPDIDGDGIPNAKDCAPFVALDVLMQCDGSDLASKDYDGDGIINCKDPDIDGDGIPNEQDGDPFRSPGKPAQK